MVQVQWGHFIQLQKFIRIELNRPSNFEHSTPNETGELLKLLVKYWNILELQKPNSAGPLRSIQVKLVYSKNIQCIHWFIMVHHFPSKIAFGCFRGVPFLRQIQPQGPLGSTVPAPSLSSLQEVSDHLRLSPGRPPGANGPSWANGESRRAEVDDT